MRSMTSEEACRHKFTQLMTDHIIGDIDRHMLSPIMNGYGMANHLREYGRTARPGLHKALLILGIHLFNLFHQALFNIRALFQGSTQSPASLFTLSDNHTVTGLPFAGFITQCRLTPGRHRAFTPDRCLAFTAAMRVIIRIHHYATHCRP